MNEDGSEDSKNNGRIFEINKLIDNFKENLISRVYV